MLSGRRWRRRISSRRVFEFSSPTPASGRRWTTPSAKPSTPPSRSSTSTATASAPASRPHENLHLDDRVLQPTLPPQRVRRHVTRRLRTVHRIGRRPQRDLIAEPSHGFRGLTSRSISRKSDQEDPDLRRWRCGRGHQAVVASEERSQHNARTTRSEGGSPCLFR